MPPSARGPVKEEIAAPRGPAPSDIRARNLNAWEAALLKKFADGCQIRRDAGDEIVDQMLEIASERTFGLDDVMHHACGWPDVGTLLNCFDGERLAGACRERGQSICTK